jgi:hypothetical protein
MVFHTRGRHLAPRPRRSTPWPTPAQSFSVVALAAALVGLFLVAPVFTAPPAAAGPLALCNNPGPAPGIKHVVVVMLENESQGNVVGNSTDAPYINSTVTPQCGYATNMYGATHWSAANYLAITAGQYPLESPAGCGYLAACNTATNNIFHQTEANGLSWKAYEEAMPGPCTKSSSGIYSLGHNPVPFYDNVDDCATYDVPVADLTAAQGPLWNDLQNRTLPSYSFVTPNNINNGHDEGTGVPAIDDFLSDFVPLVQSSNSYQDGTTAMFITFDEGTGGSKGQDCTNRSLDMAGNQDSCHIPFFVIYPFTPAGPVGGFFDHYSVTRTAEELLGLPLLAGAQTAPSLIGPFGLAAGASPTPTASPTASASPTPVATTPPPTASPTPSATAPPSETTNLVTNGGFETGTENGWNGIYTANSLTAPTQAAAQSGSWSLAITSSITDRASPVGVTSKPPVIANATGGTSLAASAWVKSSVAGVYVRQLVWETAPDGTSVGYLGKSFLLQDTAWHRIAASTAYTVKNSGDSVWFSLYTKSLPAGATLYADNLSLTTPAT